MDIRTFDADAYLAAVEPPRFLSGEREHVGVVLSAPEWFRHEATFQRLLASADPRADGALVRELCDAFFPPPPRPRWWHWHRVPDTPSVADLVAQLPYNLQLDAILTFVAAQAAAQQWTVPGLRPTKAPPATTA